MPNESDKNQDIDLSRYLDKKTIPAVLKQKPDPKSDMFEHEAKRKRQRILMAVVGFNFVFGIIIFSYLIVKSNEEAALVTVTPNQFVAPINYQLKPGEIYRPALP